MRWIRAHDRAGRVLALPNQTPGIVRHFGLTRAQVDRSAWVIDASGRYFDGAAAVNRVLTELGGAWRLLASAYRLPPIRWIEDRAYEWIARNRGSLSAVYGATPECQEPGVCCE